MEDLNVLQEVIVTAAVLNSPQLAELIIHYSNVTRGDVGNVGNIFPSKSLNDFWNSIVGIKSLLVLTILHGMNSNPAYAQVHAEDLVQEALDQTNELLAKMADDKEDEPIPF